MSADYWKMIRYCEACLKQHGDNYLGVGWTKCQQDADARYRVMLDVIRDCPNVPVRLLDFGCGASHLYEFIQRTRNLPNIHYSGLDLSPELIALSRRKFPGITYYDFDILSGEAKLLEFDYIIANGVFTLKLDNSFDQMWSFLQAVVRCLYAKARQGMAFNVMSKQVQWERADLFHASFDRVASFLTQEISRHFVFRHDYGLYEFTTYVYRKPNHIHETW